METNKQEPGDAPKERSIEDIAAEIMTILNRISVMGGNDSEIEEINKIMEDLQNGHISGEDALKKAHQIEDRKMDYH